MSSKSERLILVGGPGDFTQLFLDAYPKAHGRIARWVLADDERVPPGTTHFAIERFPRDFAPDETDIDLTDRILRKHWLDMSLMALRGSSLQGLEQRAWITGLVLKGLAFAHQLKASGERLLFVGVPHRVELFALFCACYEIGLDYAVSFESTVEYVGAIMARPFPFRPVSSSLVEQAGGALSAPGEALVQRLRASYRVATPAILVAHYNDRSVRGLIRQKLRKRKLPSIEGMKGFASRAALKRSYEQRTAGVARPSGPFIYVPLHYQPERTTLPQGRMYSDQELMVRRIAKMAPPGTHLLVREHPSTFVNGGPLWRTEDYYDRLAAIPRVTLCSTTVDPFELLDSSMAVATVTGTVALEASARGKPTMVFGAPTYVGLPGMNEVTDGPPQLMPPPSALEFEQWLAKFEKSSLSVARASAPLVNQRRDWSYHSCGMLAALYPERVEERERMRWVNPP